MINKLNADCFLARGIYLIYVGWHIVEMYAAIDDYKGEEEEKESSVHIRIVYGYTRQTKKWSNNEKILFSFLNK